MNNLITPTLYLDIDGVLLPHDPTSSKFLMKELSDKEFYSPEVVEKLGKTCLNLVWCSTWDHEQINNLTRQMNGLKNGRYLFIPDDVDGVSRTTQKLNRIVADQETSKAPFIWVDDQITQYHRIEANNLFGDTPHLLISPDKNEGLTPTQLQLIETFPSSL